jgi:hypothetical protein
MPAQAPCAACRAATCDISQDLTMLVAFVSASRRHSLFALSPCSVDQSDRLHVECRLASQGTSAGIMNKRRQAPWSMSPGIIDPDDIHRGDRRLA